jgi:hypothetical protein
MKRCTTRKGALKSRAEVVPPWESCFEDLPQAQIQAWIERIRRHIQKVIELKGGNEYKEGWAD